MQFLNNHVSQEKYTKSTTALLTKPWVYSITSYFGRLKYWQGVLNPLNSFTSNKTLIEY